jgi:hypothetical protein
MSDEKLTTGRDLERREAQRGPLSATDPIKLAEHFARSGYFKDAADLSKAVVKIAAGEELGLGPMGSMQGIHIIEGKPSLSANVLAALVKRHPVYDYIVRALTERGARIAFLQNGEPIGVSEFTMADAERAGIAGKQNFKRYPKAMMFARALSQGVRWYCPDVTAGSPAYVPEELGAEVDESGEPLEAEAPRADGEDEVQDAVVVIGQERVDNIIGGFSALGLRYGEINLLLGACGVDGLRANSAKAVRERLSSLTPEQADRIEEQLQADLDRIAEEAGSDA